ncbi:MAG: DUF1156 domain-containing protein [Planctomycetota bacterium]|nr:DUF1156 domain-containing protein [Planctomycetota bacterium]
MATKTDRPKVLIEQWLPIAEIGAECMRERGASSALPPLYFLHVWWARRPLTVSRAAILASLLPAYPTGDEVGVRPWPAKFRKRFPTFDDYKAWFKRLIGIQGDPVAARKLIDYEKCTGKRTPGNKFGYPRAFTYNPNEEQLETLYDLLTWTWGPEIVFCDPMSGGGSIPFEALRYGLTVRANELNPVANVILRATLDYPARFGPSLADDVRRFGGIWCQSVRHRLTPFFPAHPPTPDGSLKGGTHLWTRTVACPVTRKLVPLSTNWWIKKGADPVAVRLIADPHADRCRFELVHGRSACDRARPDKGTVKGGSGVSPWTGDPIPGDYIKGEAQAGRMGQQLYAIEVYDGGMDWRIPSAEDEAAYERAVKELQKQTAAWEADGILPDERRYIGPSDRLENYGELRFVDVFGPRQLLSIGIAVDEFRKVGRAIQSACAHDPRRAEAIITYLAIALDKVVDYNSRQAVWHPSRTVIAHTFSRHDFRFKWSHIEYDASRNLLPWALEQVVTAYTGIARLVLLDSGQRHLPLAQRKLDDVVDRLSISHGTAANLPDLPSGRVTIVCVDPPYYDNVIYSECADFFYVWLKRTFGVFFPSGFAEELTNKDDEAVANWARFSEFGKGKKKPLARQDYERKMIAVFREIHRVLHPHGTLAVMFTHKEVEAWDTLGTALIDAGFVIDASWPVHTENEHSLHQAKKNAAASTILLACRKRDKSAEPIWWDDLKAKVRGTARQKATEFEAQGIRGVDLYISTFGPVLSIISENWPVLTSDTDPKTGDPLPLKPGEALDLARQEVVNLRKQGLLLGRSVEFDPVTDWYLMAWDAFSAQEFPADEARKLALALGLDMEQHLVRDKRLVTKKSSSVAINLPAARRKKGMVDEDADAFPHLIDALHTAMMIYDEEGSKACQVFVDRQGLRTDSRTKALVQAMMEAIPTTRDKAGKFLRPEMTTLDALRMLFWDDLPAPKEEEPPKLDPQMKLAGFDDEDVGEDDDESEDEEDE